MGAGFGMDFGEALIQLKRGNRIARATWKDSGISLFLIKTWGYGKSTNNLPFVAMGIKDGNVTIWSPSQTDILSTDWILVKEKE
jgi:hypothetical protein